MKTRVKFTEQSKAVVAEVLIEGEEEKEIILTEAKTLFEAAQRYATTKTMQKMR